MSEWIKYSERKPHPGDELDGQIEYLWLASSGRGRASRRFGEATEGPWVNVGDAGRFTQFVKPDPDYWCTPDPLPNEESAVEKAERDLFDWWADPSHCDYREGIECISALIDAKLAERK